MPKAPSHRGSWHRRAASLLLEELEVKAKSIAGPLYLPPSLAPWESGRRVTLVTEE